MFSSFSQECVAPVITPPQVAAPVTDVVVAVRDSNTRSHQTSTALWAWAGAARTPEPAQLQCPSTCLSTCLSDPQQTPLPGPLWAPRPAFLLPLLLPVCFQSTPFTLHSPSPSPSRSQTRHASPRPRWCLRWWPSFCPTTCSPKWEHPSLSQAPPLDTSTILTSRTLSPSHLLSPPSFPTPSPSQRPAPHLVAAPRSPTVRSPPNVRAQSPPSSSPAAPLLLTCCSWRNRQATG